MFPISHPTRSGSPSTSGVFVTIAVVMQPPPGVLVLSPIVPDRQGREVETGTDSR